jgi:phosphatidylserine/phosphatidylglycerophosphate/cardiolipin synthase-like enzyme
MQGAKSAVSWVRGRGRSLMHHKFCVFLDEDRKPTSVVTGSWNWTKQSMKNVEHIVSVDDALVAARFMQEHLSVLKIAKPIRPARGEKKKKKKRK